MDVYAIEIAISFFDESSGRLLGAVISKTANSDRISKIQYLVDIYGSRVSEIAVKSINVLFHTLY